jgi:alpha-galactosidase
VPLAVTVAVAVTRCAALDDGLARVPPMAWSTWSAFGPHVNHTIVVATADKMVELGLVGAGYKYLMLDDGWADCSSTHDGP